MSAEKTVAVVIRITDFSETSRVAVLFTRDFGKISVLAKGARRLKGPFESALDLLATCQIAFLRKSAGGLDLLTESKLIERFRPAGRNMEAFYGGYYVAELLLGITEEYDSHPVLFQETCQVLQRLSEGSNVWRAISRYELIALREIGQLPALDACVRCDKPIEDFETAAFWTAQDGLFCQTCQSIHGTGFRTQLGTIAVVRRLLNVEGKALDRFAISPQQLAEIRHILSTSITHVLGRRPKMLRYLQF